MNRAKAKKIISLSDVNGMWVRITGHSERKDLVRKIKKVLANERAFRLH